MRDIDFREVDDPEEYVKQFYPNTTKKEVMEVHLAMAELLNLLWDIHTSQVASDKNYGNVNSSVANY